MENRKKILIVDDDEINRQLFKIYIGSDFIILEATNGKEALEIFNKEELDLIFMDIMMPVMNGIDATIEIKKIKPDLPIIAITAYLDSELQKLDCFDVKLNKPIQIFKVKNVLQQYLM